MNTDLFILIVFLSFTDNLFFGCCGSVVVDFFILVILQFLSVDCDGCEAERDRTGFLPQVLSRFLCTSIYPLVPRLLTQSRSHRRSDKLISDSDLY